MRRGDVDARTNMKSSDTYLGFWRNLRKPIIGLSPMDGVTDFACRFITAKTAKPDVMFTEFTTVEGLFHAPDKILRDFEYAEIERPIVAQVYGATPEYFYKAARIVCQLGFDGIDINMGCPSKAVVKRNCGAKLITDPGLAIEIIRATKQGIADFQKTIPYSIKTRIGYDSNVVEWWVEILLEEKPAAISIHGRTLKQMYRGEADWKAIGRAAKIIHQTETLILGNGDIASLTDAKRRVEEAGVDGVLIGRHAIGNPWIFGGHTATREEKIATALEHASYYAKKRGPLRLASLGKHLSGYLSHFPDAAGLRVKALAAKELEDLKRILTSPSDEIEFACKEGVYGRQNI